MNDRVTAIETKLKELEARIAALEAKRMEPPVEKGKPVKSGR